MITEALASMATGLLSWILSTLPVVDVPAWVATGRGYVEFVTGYAGAVSYWVPVSVLGPVIVSVLAAAAAGLVLKIGRVILSLATAGGGSAG